MESSPFSVSSKRAKAPGNISQVAHCLVDGCNADLSLCRDYHRRHKVCETHSKTPIVTIGGRGQRFCQQCSRFHSLVEFDEGKRICKKRLDGHNRRRRKPQPDSLSRNTGPILSGQQVAAGGKLLSFSRSQMLPNSVLNSSWAGVVKSETDIMQYNNQQQQLSYIERQNSFPQCSMQSYNGDNHLQFIQTSDCTMQETSICKSLVDPNTASGSSNSGREIFSDGLSQVFDSDRALSLLSPAPPSNRDFGLNHVVQSESVPHAESLVHNFLCCGLGLYPFAQERKAVVSSTDSHGRDPSTLHIPETFQHAPEG